MIYYACRQTSVLNEFFPSDEIRQYFIGCFSLGWFTFHDFFQLG